MLPEQFYQHIKHKIKREWIVSLVTVFVLGMIAHIYKFTNFLPNWDSILNLHTSQYKIELGRNFLALACMPGSWYDLPWVNGLLSLIYIAITAICVCELFQLRKTVPIIMASGILVTFPTVTSTFTYNYTADGYFFAMLCMALAVLVCARYKKGIFPAMFLIAFGYGSYQAYITFAVTLILLYLLETLLFEKINGKDCRNLVIRFLSAGAGGSILYWISLKLMLILSSENLSSYQNISDAFSLSKLRPIYSFLRGTYRFCTYFLDISKGVNLFLILNMCVVLLIVGMGCYSFVHYAVYKEAWRMGMVLLCIAALPAGSTLLYFVSPYLDYHNLMIMNYALIYMIPLMFYEHMEFPKEKMQIMKQWAISGVCFLIIYNFILIANISYLKMHVAYEKSYSVLVRLSDRIEQLPDYKKCKKIAVIGCLPGSEEISVNLPPDMTGITDSYIIRKQDTKMAENVTQTMLKDYCELDYADTTEQEIKEIKKKEAFQTMKNWPEEGAVKIIDDTLVIKFGKEEIENE